MHVSGEAGLLPLSPHPNWAAFSAYFLACAAAVGARGRKRRDGCQAQGVVRMLGWCGWRVKWSAGWLCRTHLHRLLCRMWAARLSPLSLFVWPDTPKSELGRLRQVSWASWALGFPSACAAGFMAPGHPDHLSPCPSRWHGMACMGLEKRRGWSSALVVMSVGAACLRLQEQTTMRVCIYIYTYIHT